jgi:hypothetical protein
MAEGSAFVAWWTIGCVLAGAIPISVLLCRRVWRMCKPMREMMKHYANGDYTYNFFKEEREKAERAKGGKRT